MNNAPPSRILIMDDEETILKMMEIMLSGRGFEPATAQNGEEAVAKYKQSVDSGSPFDVLILDFSVRNGMGAMEAMPELLKINPGVKVVVASGYAGDPVLENYQEHGFSAVIAKPFRPQQIVDLIGTL